MEINNMMSIINRIFKPNDQLVKEYLDSKKPTCPKPNITPPSQKG